MIALGVFALVVAAFYAITAFIYDAPEGYLSAGACLCVAAVCLL